MNLARTALSGSSCEMPLAYLQTQVPVDRPYEMILYVNVQNLPSLSFAPKLQITIIKISKYQNIKQKLANKERYMRFHDYHLQCPPCLMDIVIIISTYTQDSSPYTQNGRDNSVDEHDLHLHRGITRGT